MQTAAPSEVLGSNMYSKSSLKRVVKDFDAKDVRRSIEALFKRVDKHFDDEGDMVNSTNKVVNGTVMAGVWQACEEKFVKETQRFSRLISQCYGDSGVTLDFTVGDVQTAFRKHRS